MLGWMYEHAMEDSQRYKEGKVILEHALIEEIEGFPDPLGEEIGVENVKQFCSLCCDLLYVALCSFYTFHIY
ncbi:unnamed protein product [Dibothriocephalus latus]|uniref:Yippee domain-containing protein n=1 Tax=Dibothriocephalus latus TaxID=60516 RepID=A0A3P6R8L8_DIBLA|nr:unnamed protein product [Dibothriocephalus latus]